jgi:hypothetical protein
MKFTTWDEYVGDAQRAPIVINISNTETVSASMPTGEQIERLNTAATAGDQAVLLDELFGVDGAARLREIGRSAPAFALANLVNDVLDEFGMSAPVLTAVRAVLGKDPAQTSST